MTETARESTLLWDEGRAELRFTPQAIAGAVPLLMVSSWDLSTSDPWSLVSAPFSLTLETLPPPPTPHVRDLVLDTPVRGQLDVARGAFLTDWDDELPAELWRVEVRGARMLRIIMAADAFDPHVEFGLWDGQRFTVLDEDDHGGPTEGSILRTVVPEDGRYWIRARSFTAAVGDGAYTLVVVPDSMPPPLRQPIMPGAEPVFSRLTPEDALLPGTRIPFHEWVLEAEAGVPVVIHMRSDEVDSYLSLGYEDVDGRFVELAFNDDDPTVGPDNFTLDSRIDFTPETSRTYIIRARTFSPGQFGVYAVEVSARTMRTEASADSVPAPL
jgi:hypothetical protein